MCCGPCGPNPLLPHPHNLTLLHSHFHQTHRKRHKLGTKCNRQVGTKINKSIKKKRRKINFVEGTWFLSLKLSLGHPTPSISMALSKPFAPFHVPTVSYTFNFSLSIKYFNTLISCVHIINETWRIQRKRKSNLHEMWSFSKTIYIIIKFLVYHHLHQSGYKRKKGTEN